MSRIEELSASLPDSSLRCVDAMRITFEIPGPPHGKARHRAGKWGMYNPKSNIEYESMVKRLYLEAAHGARMWDGAVAIRLKLYFPIPRRASKAVKAAMAQGKIRPAIKSDIDNCAKSVMDGLNGAAYHDDKQVVDLKAEKWYAFEPRTEVTVMEVSTDEPIG